MKKLAGLAVLALAVGCIGEVPPQPDPGTDPPPGPDAGNEPAVARISGTVSDFETGDPLANATVTTEGLASPLTATTDALGAYEFNDVLPDEITGFMVTADPVAFFITHNPQIVTDGTEQIVNLRAVGTGYAARSQNNVTPPVAVTPGTSYVLIEMLKGDGTPRDGVALADFLALDGAQAPVGDGTFFVNGLGLADAAITTSTTASSTVAVFNVPPAATTFQATYPADNDGGNGGQPQLKTLAVTPQGDHAYIRILNNKPVLDALGGGGGGGGGGI